MNYIYDIVINLNKNNLYEFYEWEELDNPEFILKIPVFRVDEDTFLNMKNNQLIINKKFLDTIENKTESYSPNCINIIRYASVFVCDTNTLVIEFDSDGNNYMKSNISIDEENEILDISKSLKYSIIDYKIKKQLKNNKKFITRRQQNQEKEVLEKIENIKNNKEYSKLKYIFFEMYDEKMEDIEKIYNKLINIIKSDNNKFEKLYNILMMIENKKIMSNNS